MTDRTGHDEMTVALAAELHRDMCPDDPPGYGCDVCTGRAQRALAGTDSWIRFVDIIGPGEIRQLAGGVTRATMKHWREGRNTRGAGTFPAPFKTVSGVELYDRRAVLAWLEEHRPA
jgi:hypothetical protein